MFRYFDISIFRYFDELFFLLFEALGLVSKRSTSAMTAGASALSASADVADGG